MYRYTERIGEIERIYESDTAQGVIELKNAINPRALKIKSNLSPEQLKEIAEQIGKGCLLSSLT